MEITMTGIYKVDEVLPNGIKMKSPIGTRLLFEYNEGDENIGTPEYKALFDAIQNLKGMKRWKMETIKDTHNG